MEVLNRTAIKAEARCFIAQDKVWLKLFLPCLPVLILSGGLSYGVTLWKTYSENGGYQEVRYQTGGGLAGLLLLPLTVAFAGFFLNHIRGFHPEWKSLYQEGFNRYGKYFAVGFLTNLLIGLWTLLLIVPGILKALEYSQVHYIIHDNPNLSPSQARDISRRMTDGFKSELFIMELSFFLWYMLAGITVGIAMVYVFPYVSTTRAMYYENLKTYAMTANRVSPAEFGILPVPPYTQPPYTESQNTASMYGMPQQPSVTYGAENSGFTPPAPEETFQPGDTPNLRETPLNESFTENEERRF